MRQNSCSEQLSDRRCHIWREVFCQAETSRPVLKLHCTVFHYVEDSLHPDSSPALIKASLWSFRGSPMPRQSETLSYVSDTTCHSGFCSVSVNRAQPLPRTFSNHVWSRYVWRLKLTFTMSAATCYLPAKLHNIIQSLFLKEIRRERSDNRCEIVGELITSVGYWYIQTLGNGQNNRDTQNMQTNSVALRQMLLIERDWWSQIYQEGAAASTQMGDKLEEIPRLPS